jgi:MFS family permease
MDRGRQALAISVAAQTLAVLPVFLLGSLWPLIGADAGLDAFGLGVAVACYYLASAAGSGTLSHLSDTFGPWRTIRAGLGLGALALVGIAVLPAHLASFGGTLAIAGLANGFIQPAANVAIARGVGLGTQGFAFGLKQSAIPAATLAGGLAVPGIALTLGWRAAFALAAALTLAAILRLPRDGASARLATRHGIRSLDRRVLLTFAAMSGCGAGCANAMASFLVPSVVASGHEMAAAGLVLAAGSMVSIVMRLALGLAADRLAFSLLPAVALLFLGGAAGYLALAFSEGWATILAGTFLAFGLGWGWSGLSILAIVRWSGPAAAAATGFTQAGVFVGAIIGPFAFGSLAERASYPTAWLALAGVATLAALLALCAARLTRSPPPRSTEPIRNVVQ